MDKIVIHFRPAGNAPILKQSKFKLSPSLTVHSVQEFLVRQLQCESVPFVYVNSAFAPSPEQVVGDLFNCYAIDNCLIINYSITAAWG
jgi:ubiquitin-like protein ATG12